MKVASLHRAAALALSIASGSLVQAASITGVTPRGEVAQVRQVTVRFSEAVVPFGDLRQPDPMGLACEGPVPTGSGGPLNAGPW